MLNSVEIEFMTRTSILNYTPTLRLLLRMNFFFYKELHLNCNLISSVSTKELAEGTSVLEGEKVTFLVYRVK